MLKDEKVISPICDVINSNRALHTLLKNLYFEVLFN